MGCLLYDITIKFYSWAIVIIYCAVIGVLFLVKMTKAPKEVKSQKEMFRSIGLFFFFYITVRIFFLFSDFERDAHCETILYFQYVFMGYIFSILAFLSILNFGEKYLIKKTKHAITTTIIVCVVIDLLIVIFLPNLVKLQLNAKYGENYSQTQQDQAVFEVATMVRYFNYVIQYTSMGIVLILYLYLTVKSTGKLRRNASITLLGLAVAAVAALLETDALLRGGKIPPYLSPIIFSIGLTIFAFAYLKTTL